MIASTVDKKDHVESMTENSRPLPSYSFDLPIINLNQEEGNKFKHIVVNQNWKKAQNLLKISRNKRTLLQMGDLYLLKENYKKAIKHYLEIIDIDSNFIPAYQKIIIAYLTHKRYEDAEKYFLKLIDLTERRSDILHHYAIFKAILKQEHSTVVNILDEILIKEPNNFAALNTKGFILLNFENRIKDAKDIFNKALSINNTFFHSLNNLAVCHIKLEESTEAKRILIKSLDLARPDYPFMHQNLAHLYIKDNNFNDALETLNSAIKKGIQIEHGWEHIRGWLLIEAGNLEEARDWYLNKIKEEPENDLLYNNLGFCYMRLNKSDLAGDNFNKAIELFKKHLKSNKLKDSRSLLAFYNLGRLAVHKGDLGLVKDLSEEIIKIDPNDKFAIYLSGAFELLSEKYNEAQKIYENLLNVEEKIHEVYPDLAFIYVSINGDSSAAIKLLNKAILLGFRSPSIINNLAYAYIQNKDLKEAQIILEKYSQTPNPMLIATRGLLEFRKDNIKDANKFYELVLDFLTKKHKNIAQQIQNYENAYYYFRKKDFQTAKEFIEKADSFPESYFTKDINKFKERLKSEL